MTLEAALAATPPTDAKALAKLHQTYGGAPDYIETLIALTPAHPTAATWLLKHGKEASAPPPKAPHRLWTAAEAFEDWPPKLHLAQIADWAPPPETATKLIEAWTRDKKPMLRAWALTAAHHLATSHPAAEDWADQLLKTATQDPAKSVQARLRNLAKRRQT